MMKRYSLAMAIVVFLAATMAYVIGTTKAFAGDSHGSPSHESQRPVADDDVAEEIPKEDSDALQVQLDKVQDAIRELNSGRKVAEESKP